MGMGSLYSQHVKSQIGYNCQYISFSNIPISKFQRSLDVRDVISDQMAATYLPGKNHPTAIL